LSDFILTEKDGLPGVFSDYYDEMERLSRAGYVSKRVKRMVFDPMVAHASFVRADSHAVVAEFLGAARMNLKYAPSITAVSETMSGVGPGFAPSFSEPSALDVLVAFADEPDKGMDQDLWQYADYGFGKIPYGSETGFSSQAPFHMQFVNENFAVRMSAPEILDGMTLERMLLFSRLAKFAHAKGHHYWGYRFTAWALHYLEDICQPYHAKALPPAGFWYYVKLAFSFQKEKIKRETTQLVHDRHIVYEDYAAKALNTDEKGVDKKLKKALQASPVYFEAHDEVTLFKQMALMSARRARELDRAVAIAENGATGGMAIEGAITGGDAAVVAATEELFALMGRAVRTFVKQSASSALSP
ncbi:MAG: hypothetical protein V2B19_33655, partial [Pseudomonadota bacterium]